MENSLAVAELLLRSGADVHAKDKVSSTLIQCKEYTTVRNDFHNANYMNYMHQNYRTKCSHMMTWF